MSNLINGIVFSLSIDKDFENRDIAKKIIDIFLSASKSIRPKKFGAFQADLKIEDSEKVADVLVNAKGPKFGPRGGSLILKESNDCSFSIQWDKSVRQTFPFISGRLMFESISKNPNILTDFFDLVKKLALILSPEFGSIESMAVKGWDTPRNLLLRLPDILPVMIYGKSYITFFGEEKIKSSPFLKIERLGDCYWLVAHESIFEKVPDAKRAEIRSYFGEDSFMANGKWKYTNGSAPVFDLSFSICS